MGKHTPKSKKRAPKEARPVAEPIVALGPTKSATQSMALLLDDFKKAHADGMAALEKRDFDALGDAIKREHDIIETQSELIERSTGTKSTRRK